MNTFPRTIFGGGKHKHYDQITWHTQDPNRFSLAIDDCGYFDIDTVLRPGYDMPAGPFSFRISDHYPSGHPSPGHSCAHIRTDHSS